MRPWVSVGALAIAARRANVAGVVRLTITPDGLEIELVRVSAATLGFAPGGVAEPTAFRVPYTAVRGLVREGHVLYLALDQGAITPYSRFALARFADDPEEIPADAQRAGTHARWASFALPIPFGLLAATLDPPGLAGGALGRAAVGSLAALASWVLLRELAVWRTWGGPTSDRIRDRFERELAKRLALVPPDAVPLSPAVRIPVERRLPPARYTPEELEARRSPAAPPPPAPPPPGDAARPAGGSLAPALDALLARRHEVPPAPPPREIRTVPIVVEEGDFSGRRRLVRALVAALAAAVLVVGVVAFLGRYAAARTPPPAVDRARAGLAAAVGKVHLDLPPLPKPDACTCMRADSPLWKDGVPRLSVLTFDSDEGPTVEPTPTPDGTGFPQYAFDLAIVNNGARGLRDVRVTLTFSRRGKDGKRAGAVDRGLFWGGVLLPGHAAKWHVEAPGNDIKKDITAGGTLAAARLDPAPADSFFKLTSARARAVRLHGAVMLAYLRDPRALEAARALAARAPVDELTLARVRRASAPVIACDVKREAKQLSACIFNASTAPRGGLALREVLPAAPGGAEPRTIALPDPVPVHEGLRLRLEVPPDLADELAVIDPSSPD